MDGLQTSEYLRQTAQNNTEGKITLSEANRLIESYYREAAEQGEDRTQEADQVSARIAALLAENAFSFSAVQYLGIHRRLFEGIYPHAGQVRDYNISKRAWVLGKKNVLRNRDLHIGGALGKQEGVPAKQGIEIFDPVTAKTKAHI